MVSPSSFTNASTFFQTGSLSGSIGLVDGSKQCRSQIALCKKRPCHPSRQQPKSWPTRVCSSASVTENQLAVQQDIHSPCRIAGHKVHLTSVLGAVTRSVFAGVHIVSAIGINIKLAALVTNLGESLNLGNILSTSINVLQIQRRSTGLGELQIELVLSALM